MRERKPSKRLPRAPRKPHGGARPGAGAKMKSAPADLLAKLEKPKNADELIEALAAVGFLAAKGTLSTSAGRLCVELARETRQVLIKLKSKEAPSNVLTGAIDVLLPDERAVLDTYRRSKTPPPLKPGEAVAPPPAPNDPAPPSSSA